MGGWREDKCRLYSNQDTGKQEAPNCPEGWTLSHVVLEAAKQPILLSFQARLLLRLFQCLPDLSEAGTRKGPVKGREHDQLGTRTPPITLGCAESNPLHGCDQTLGEFRTICSPGEQRQRLLACCLCSCIMQLSVLFYLILSWCLHLCVHVHMSKPMCVWVWKPDVDIRLSFPVVLYLIFAS